MCFFPIILGSEKKLLLVIFPNNFTTKLLLFPSHGHLADLAGEVLDWASKGVLLGLSSLGSQLVARPGLSALFKGVKSRGFNHQTLMGFDGFCKHQTYGKIIEEKVCWLMNMILTIKQMVFKR